jgi:hypothetical protein
MAYKFNSGGGGATNSTSWNSATTQNKDKFERIRNYGKIIGVADSPFFPKTPVEFQKHQAEYAIQRHDEERFVMENRLVGMEALKRCGVKVCFYFVDFLYSFSLRGENTWWGSSWGCC